MRIRSLVFLVAMLVLTLAAPAAAMDGHSCDHESDTIESLAHCVHHALEMDHITNAGVGDSLLAKTTAAQTALDRGQLTAAVNILRTFIAEVQAQAGVHIDAEHADHLIMHAQMVIDELAP